MTKNPIISIAFESCLCLLGIIRFATQRGQRVIVTPAAKVVKRVNHTMTANHPTACMIFTPKRIKIKKPVLLSLAAGLSLFPSSWVKALRPQSFVVAFLRKETLIQLGFITTYAKMPYLKNVRMRHNGCAISVKNFGVFSVHWGSERHYPRRITTVLIYRTTEERIC